MKARTQMDECNNAMTKHLHDSIHSPLEFELLLEKISRYIEKKNYILDLGSGNGEFIEFMIQHDYGNAIGSDYSPLSEKIHLDKGLRFWKIDLREQFDLKTSSFDVITCFDVIEHLFDVDFALRECYRVLKPKGRLIIKTPNSSWWKVRLTYLITGKTPTQIQHLAHIRFFNVKMVKQLVKHAGFKKVKSLASSFFNETILVVGTK